MLDDSIAHHRVDIGATAGEARSPAPPRRLRFSSGRTVETRESAEGDHLRVRAATGEVVLTVLLTDAGPVLRFGAADLEVKAGALTLDCDTFQLRAREDACIEVGGDLVETIQGGATREVAGGASLSAEEVALTARTGNVDIRANDDVDVRGERIRLNCDDAPMPITWEEHVARHGGEPPA
ncbi:MAG: hypothetical protein IT372_27810 [Polyangiaceae bacterium]|nr:hypothetical protein [Polyangiaceae bacterium]